MSDFKLKNKVVQSNDLIQLSKWNLNTMPLKIFKALVSCIDTKNPTNNVSITKKELSDLLETGENYTRLRKQVQSLQKQIVEVNLDNGGILSLSIMPKVYYPPYNSSEPIQCSFSEELMPFLINLQERFLQYDIGNIRGFSSKYGLILYEYLLSRERQERSREHKYLISLEDLRRLTDTQTKFKTFKDLKRNVVEKAIEDINNSNVEFLVKFKANGKRGVPTTHIEFTLRNRTSYKETDFDIVENPSYLMKKI